MKKVLVTGASGFIGGYVLEELKDKGYSPIAFDRHNKGNLPDGVEFFQGDITDDVLHMLTAGFTSLVFWALRKPLRIPTQQHTLTFWVG
jgi:nucleoside-diphosphate-sugar epimerase